jgi:hypothetical protein
MHSKLLQPAQATEEIDRLEHHHSLDDATGATYERVVWKHSATLKTNTLDRVGLAGTSSEYPSLRALHVGDPDFWFERLVEDYSRASRAWVIEITPVEGDYITDDPQYVIPDAGGNRADSQVLVTQRTVLREGVDFEYSRELSASDLSAQPDEEEESDGYGSYGYSERDEYDDDDDQ